MGPRGLIRDNRGCPQQLLPLAPNGATTIGAHFASAGVISSDQSHYAAWSGFTDPGNRFRVDMVLPTALAKVGGGGNGDIPFSCGTASLYVANTTLVSAFDPHVPATFGPVTPPGDYVLRLGWQGGLPGDPRALCSVDLTGRSAGTYSATITATVTII